VTHRITGSSQDQLLFVSQDLIINSCSEYEQQLLYSLPLFCNKNFNVH